MALVAQIIGFAVPAHPGLRVREPVAVVRRVTSAPRLDEGGVQGQPLTFNEAEVKDSTEGLTQREINSLNEAIAEAEKGLEIPERYSRLKESALSRIKAGEASLIFDLDSHKTVDIDLKTYKSRPVKIIDEDSKVWVWPANP